MKVIAQLKIAKKKEQMFFSLESSFSYNVIKSIEVEKQRKKDKYIGISEKQFLFSLATYFQIENLSFLFDLIDFL